MSNQRLFCLFDTDFYSYSGVPCLKFVLPLLLLTQSVTETGGVLSGEGVGVVESLAHEEKRSPLGSAFSFGGGNAKNPFAAPGKRYEYSGTMRGPFAAPGKRPWMRPFAAPGKRLGGNPFAAWGGLSRPASAMRPASAPRPFAAPGKRRTFTEGDAAVVERKERGPGEMDCLYAKEKRSPFGRAREIMEAQDKRNPFARLWSTNKRGEEDEGENIEKRSPLGAAKGKRHLEDASDDNNKNNNNNENNKNTDINVGHSDNDNNIIDHTGKAESRVSGFSKMLREEEGDEELGSLISEHVFCLLECRRREGDGVRVNGESKCQTDCLRNLNN